MSSGAKMAVSKEDLDEAESMLRNCKRPFLKRKLEAIVKDLQGQLAAEDDTGVKVDVAAAVMPAAPAPGPVKLASPAAPAGDKVDWTEVPSFAWDQGEHNSQWVSVYLMSGLDGVGDVKDGVSCDFTTSSFDLKIVGLHGKNYRLCKTNLDKEIDAEKSKIVVKKDKITIKLKKVKGDYGYGHWADLVSKKSEDQKKKEDKDPMSGIMDLMKNMYDEGDDDMKRTIGEAMMKSRNGEKMAPDSDMP